MPTVPPEIGRAAREGSLHNGRCNRAGQLWKEWLEAQDLSELGLLEVPPCNRYTSSLLRAMLEAAGDRDREFLRQAEMGYPWASWIRYRGPPTSSKNS